MTASKETPAIVVLGSFMTDTLSYVKRLPKLGETVSGHKLVICCGGKGANQCVAAARLGAKTAIIGKLGNDSFGETHLDALRKDNIDLSQISKTTEALSGFAQIMVEDSGQNCVVTVSGANDLLTPEDVKNSRDILSTAKVMLCEIQIPRETALSGMRIANELGVLTVFTAAPAVPDLEPEFFSLSDVFCVNETEAELLTGLPVASADEAVAAARRLIEKGCKNWVVLTLGSEGAVLLGKKEPNKPALVPTPKVEAVDTTGAGDCFLGALAYFMAYHPDWPMEKMIEKSCIVASVSVQKSGTQPSFPARDQLDAAIFN